MKTLSTGQQGVIALIWLYGLGALAIIAALTGLVIAWNNYTSGLDKKGYERGKSEITASFQKRDNAQLQAVLVAQRQAEIRAAKAEADAAKSQVNAISSYAKGVSDGKNRLAGFIASGTRLRDPGVSGTGAAGCPATSPATVTSGAAGSHGAEGSFLSSAAADFLLNEANRADEVTLQLTAAQAVIVSDRVLCNAP